MLKKIIISIVVLAFLGFGLYYKTEVEPLRRPQVSSSGKPIVRIGAIFPLTGNMADIGYAAYKGFAKGIEDANANPQNRLYYELLAEDDQMQPRRTKTIADKFVYLDRVNVLIGLFSTSVRVIAPIAAQRQILNFNLAYADAGLGTRYNFQNFTTTEAEADALTRFLISRNITDVFLFFANQGGADDLLARLLPKLKEQNIRVVMERFNPGERRFAIPVMKIKRTNTQAVLVYAFSPEQDIIAKEFRQQKLKKIVNFVDGIRMARDLSSYEGWYNTGAVGLSSEVQRYLGLDGKNPAYANYLYDSATMIVNAFERTYDGVNIPSADAVSATLLSRQKYSGLVGDYVLDDRGQFHSPVETTMIKDGAFVKVE
ncbi:MAG: ABC transporter substrate-binding protein [Alphaproteobacteria bacterium]|nr:ABC transporter substrate-binding protein [Alphaproteobacteria bacterium]